MRTSVERVVAGVHDAVGEPRRRRVALGRAVRSRRRRDPVDLARRRHPEALAAIGRRQQRAHVDRLLRVHREGASRDGLAVSSAMQEADIETREDRMTRAGPSRSQAGAARAPGTDATSLESLRTPVECPPAPSAGDERGRCAHAPAITASDGRVRGESTGTTVRIGETSARLAADRQRLHRLGGHVQQSEI